MSKMILYWKSNSKTELGFYRFNQKNNTRLSDEQINIHIAEAFAEMDEEEYSDEQISTPRVTTDGEVIPEDNCRVIIESVWIDELVNLSHRLITNEIGDIPSDMFDQMKILEMTKIMMTDQVLLELVKVIIIII